MTGAGTGVPKRETYRHGDLRRAGVAPSAAYRHFADRRALLDAVCSAALAELAGAMEAELAGLPRDVEPDGGPAVARARFGAVGRGYLRFAREEPGLFRTAFSASENLGDTASPVKAGEGGLTPFQLLGSALDGLVEAGVLPPGRRPGAGVLALAAVHRPGVLLVDGPLRGLDEATGDDVGRRLIDMVERGL